MSQFDDIMEQYFAGQINLLDLEAWKAEHPLSPAQEQELKELLQIEASLLSQASSSQSEDQVVQSLKAAIDQEGLSFTLSFDDQQESTDSIPFPGNFSMPDVMAAGLEEKEDEEDEETK